MACPGNKSFQLMTQAFFPAMDFFLFNSCLKSKTTLFDLTQNQLLSCTQVWCRYGVDLGSAGKCVVYVGSAKSHNYLFGEHESQNVAK